jgi:hypothetical protein
VSSGGAIDTLTRTYPWPVKDPPGTPETWAVTIAGEFVIAGGDTAVVFHPAPHPLDKIAVFVGREVDIPLVLVCRIGRDDGGRPAQSELHPKLLGVIAHVADQASVGRQLRRQFVACRDVGDVARCQAEAEQPALTVGDAMDLGRSAAAGSADLLLFRTAFSAGSGTLNLDGGAVDGSRVVGDGLRQRVENPLPKSPAAPAVEAIVDRRGGSIDCRAVLPPAAAAQDMDNPTDDPPVVLAARTGVDLGKQRIDRRPCFVANQVLVSHGCSVAPAKLAGLNRKTLAIPSA